MKRIYTFLIFQCISSLLLPAQSLSTLDFFIGTWKLQTIDIQPDGSFVKGQAISEVKYILDGYAIQDDFMMLNREGEVVFRGTSIRSYNQQSGKYQIAWIMPGHRGFTDIEAEWNGGKLISTGKGYDAFGDFLERFEYYDITDKSYSFRMDRSYDGGKTWIKDYSQMTATKVKP